MSAPTRDTVVTVAAAADFLARQRAERHEIGARHIVYKLPGERWARTDAARAGHVRLRLYAPANVCPCLGG